MNIKCPLGQQSYADLNLTSLLGGTTDCKTLSPSLVQTDLITSTLKREEGKLVLATVGSCWLISVVWWCASVTAVAWAGPPDHPAAANYTRITSIFFSQNKTKFRDAADDVTFAALKYSYFMVCHLFTVVVVILRKHIPLIFFLYSPPPLQNVSHLHVEIQLANEKQSTPVSISTASGQF